MEGAKLIEEITNERLSFDEAVSVLRRSRRKSVYLRVTLWAPFKLQNPAKHHEQGKECSVFVKVPTDEALRVLCEEIPPHHRRELCVLVGISKRCMFVGSSPR